MRWASRQLVALSLVAALGCTLAWTGSAGALVTTSQPHLALNRLIRTSPFVGSTTTVRDNEDAAYVPSDDSLWLADDNGNAIYEVNRTTGALKQEISQTSFINSHQLGGTNTAGKSRNEDLEAIAYDANADALYAFSGSTSAIPTVYKLTRGSNNRFQIDSWQPLPSEWTGAGWRLADGHLYVANGSTIRTYDYASNTFGTSFSISGLSNIFDIAFDNATGDLVAVNHSQRLYRASMATKTLLAGWSGIDLTPFGFLDTRGVEVIGNQLFICDGYDYRSSSDPMNHAVFVLDVTAPGGGTAPVASFTTSVSSGTAPLPVQFTDTSSDSPTSWDWDFGDGTAHSSAQSPSHTYTGAGTFTATLTATNGSGSDSTSHTITVTSTPVPPTAGFTTSVSSGFVPLPVQFTDTSTGVPTSWDWDFGDGTAHSSAESPSHTYTTTGTFTATLTASNGLGSSSISHSITVNPAPTELILPLDADTYLASPSPTKNYASYPVMKLHAPSSEYRPLVKFTVSGLSGPPTSVKLRLYVTDASTSGGDWFLVSNSWTENTVNWNNKPALPASPVASAGAITAGTWVDIDLTSAITGNGTYSFMATSTSTNTAQFSSTQGTNAPQVVLDVTGSGGGTAPTAGFTTSVSSGTAPLPVQFTDTSTGSPTSWDWDFGDGTAHSSAQSPSHTYTGAGTFTATLTATNGSGSDSTSHTITVTSTPVLPTAGFTTSVSSGFVPLPVQFTDTSTGEPDELGLGLRRRHRAQLRAEPVAHLHRHGDLHRHADRDQRTGFGLGVARDHGEPRADRADPPARRRHLRQQPEPDQELRLLPGHEAARAELGVPTVGQVHGQRTERATDLGQAAALRHRRQRQRRKLVPRVERVDREHGDLEQHADDHRERGRVRGGDHHGDVGRHRPHQCDHRQRHLLVHGDVDLDQHRPVLEHAGHQRTPGRDRPVGRCTHSTVSRDSDVFARFIVFASTQAGEVMAATSSSSDRDARLRAPCRGDRRGRVRRQPPGGPAPRTRRHGSRHRLLHAVLLARRQAREPPRRARSPIASR